MKPTSGPQEAKGDIVSCSVSENACQEGQKKNTVTWRHFDHKI